MHCKATCGGINSVLTAAAVARQASLTADDAAAIAAAAALSFLFARDSGGVLEACSVCSSTLLMCQMVCLIKLLAAYSKTGVALYLPQGLPASAYWQTDKQSFKQSLMQRVQLFGDRQKRGCRHEGSECLESLDLNLGQKSNSNNATWSTRCKQRLLVCAACLS